MSQRTVDLQSLSREDACQLVDKMNIPIPGYPYLVLRTARKEDIPAIVQADKEAWDEELSLAEEMIKSRLSIFPQGVWLVEDREKNKIVANFHLLIINYSYYEGRNYTWEEVTGNGYIENHDPNGNVCYAVNIGVVPEYNDKGIAKFIIMAVGRILMLAFNLDATMAGLRIFGYQACKSQMSVTEYLAHVSLGELLPIDPYLHLIVDCGGRLIRPLPDYWKADKESDGWAVEGRMDNPMKVFLDSLKA